MNEQLNLAKSGWGSIVGYDGDEGAGEWVAENPGSGRTAPGDLPARGEPNSYGYDGNGDRLPYANHRPA